jgi:hypothetical protein
VIAGRRAPGHPGAGRGGAAAGGQAAHRGDDEHPGDDRQRGTRTDLRHGQRPQVVHARPVQTLAEHLEADEGEDGGQAGGEVDEPVEQPTDQEVQVAQAQQGEHVRGEHQERVPGQAEDRRDGVKREQHIGHPDGDDQHQHRGGVPAAPCPRGEPGTIAAGGDRQETPCDAGGTAVACPRDHVAAGRHPDGGVEQEPAEEVLHPAELVQRRASQPDQQPAQQEREKNAQQQNAAVVLARHPGTADQQDEDEKVVQRQAVFGQPAGEELARRRSAARGGNQCPEGHRERDRRRRPHRRFGQAHLAPPPGTDDQVRGQQNAKGRDSRGPGPEGNVEDFHDLPGQAPIRAPDVPFAAGRAGRTGRNRRE